MKKILTVLWASVSYFSEKVHASQIWINPRYMVNQSWLAFNPRHDASTWVVQHFLIADVT